MSAPSDGARADARKARAAGRERYVPEDATEALGWFIGAQRDQHPRLSTDMDSFDLAAAILASDWLAGVIADAKAEALREAADLYRSLGDSLPICAGHVVAELDIRADDWACR